MLEAVYLHEVSKSYPLPPSPGTERAGLGRTALRASGTLDVLYEVSFSVQPQELFIVSGELGSGKSTLLRLVAGQLQPDHGVVRVFGADPAAGTGRANPRASLASAGGSFFGRLSAVENLLYELSPTGAGGARRRVEEMLARLGLNEPARRRSMLSLSRSDQAKVTLARLLLSRRPLLLLDEPTAAIEPEGRQAAWNLISELRQNEGAAMLVATSDPDEVAALCAGSNCSRTASLAGGRLSEAAACGLNQPCFSPRWVEALG
jgi:thiamine transport system ATP-binding protein